MLDVGNLFRLNIIAFCCIIAPASSIGQLVFINEIHYDNAGTDTLEGIEIAGPAGTNLVCYEIDLYNGGTGAVYSTIALSGIIDDEGCGYGAIWFPVAAIQNGAPDGMALYNTCTFTLVQFLSYEGTFTGVGGPSNGVLSTDIGVTEPPADTGQSLQLTGNGTTYPDFTWIGPIVNTYDAINTGQNFCPIVATLIDITSYPYLCIGADSAFSITVCATDSAQNVDTTYTGTITLSKISGNGSLTGTLSMTATSGCATFNGLSIDSSGVYVLVVSDGSLINDTTGNMYVSDSCGKCFEIEAILVDACNPNYFFHCKNGILDVDETGIDCGGNDCISCPGTGLPPGAEEGENEMVRFVVGNNDLNTADISVNWPNNPWLGICQDSTTAAIVDSINSTITLGGMVLEPVNGIIPAGSIVILVTSTTFDYLGHNWAYLNYNLYMIFQCAGNTQGHFRNYDTTSVPRTLIIDFANACSDTVSYIPNQLTNQTDGDGVDFDPAGNAAYGNNGCMPPIFPVAIYLTLSPVSNSCNNSCDGTATAFLTGGIAPFTYAWNTSPVQTDSTATGLCAGTYTVTVTDIASSVMIDSIIINEPFILAAVISSFTNVGCFGDSSGNALVSASGGTLPYTFLWDDDAAQTDSIATGLPAGTYQVLVTDVNGCSDSDTVAISQPPVLSVNISDSININCFGSSTGSASLTVNGGTAPYTYFWNTTPVQTDSMATGLAAGTYFVTVTDNNGCGTTINTTITQPNALALSTTTVDAGCGLTDGSASVSVSGGVVPFSYSWSTTPVQTDSMATGLGLGGYTVTVTDSNACVDSASATVSNTGGPALTVSDSTNILCNGDSTGSATVSANGGTLPYSYLWNDPNIQTDTTATGLAAGTYSVTVTDSGGCASIASVILTEPTTVSIVTAAINPSCNGFCNGILVCLASGGSPGYVFVWSDSLLGNNDTAAGVCSGPYNVTVTDINNCTAVASYLVSNPALINLVTNSTDAGCGLANGSASLTVNGGTPPYSYLWNDANAQTDSVASGLPSGSFNVIVTDNAGCSTTDTINVSAGNTGCLNIPTSFTPNKDGTNDVWIIRGLEAYPNNIVEIYNRWGSLLFRSEGYAEPWDGTYKGQDAAMATYYFIVVLNDEDKPLTGTVTIVR